MADTVPRFLAPALDPGLGAVDLPPEEAHHLARVLRLRPGDEVRVFDGRGGEYAARVGEVRGSAARLILAESVLPPAESTIPLTLLQAVLKGEAMDAVVRDATMMGVAAIQPVLSAHVAVRPALAQRPGQVTRWERLAVASAKQSRRATVPRIAAVAPLAQALAAAASPLTLFFVEPSAGPGTPLLRTVLAEPRPLAATLVVGPEGGWTADEIAAATAAGARPVSLGGLTLRADAVALAALAVLRCSWDDPVPEE